MSLAEPGIGLCGVCRSHLEPQALSRMCGQGQGVRSPYSLGLGAVLPVGGRPVLH